MKSMLRFLADENFNNRILDGLVHRNPEIDFVRVQDIGLSGADDPSILRWAAENRRIVLTHDVNTLTAHAYARVKSHRPMPGVCQVPDALPIGQAIEDLLIIVACSGQEEWDLQIHYLPL